MHLKSVLSLAIIKGPFTYLSLPPPAFVLMDYGKVLHIPRGSRTFCGGVLPVCNPRILHGGLAGANVRHLHAGFHLPAAAVHPVWHLHVHLPDHFK